MKNFLRENAVLVVGIVLPFLLMIGFMLAANVPQAMADPPKYDVIFTVKNSMDSTPLSNLSTRFVVRNGELKVQYMKNIAPEKWTREKWNKLYRYDAHTQIVRQLAFDLPADSNTITENREETVEATAGLKLDTAQQSPDGYTFSTDSNRPGRSELLGAMLWGAGDDSPNVPRFRKGSVSFKLKLNSFPNYSSYSNIEFIGWVINK